MAEPTDVTVIDTLSVQNDAAPATRDIDNLGGFRSVADAAERLAVPSNKRVYGMELFQRDTGQKFQLGPDLLTWLTAATAGGNFVQEALTIPVDEKGGNVRVMGDPSFPTGYKFRSQNDVDAALAGADAFRFMNDCTDALAGLFSAFNITFAMSGITDDQFGRPGDTSVGYNWSRTFFIGDATWLIEFPDSSTWPTAGFSGVTITSHQDGSQNPFINFDVGEGIPNNRSLEALFVRLSTGQLLRVRAHTDTQIQVVEQITDTIVDGVTTFDVVIPFRFRNIEADTVSTPLVPNGGNRVFFYDRGPLAIGRNSFTQQADFLNVGFDGGTQNNVHHTIRSAFRFENCFFDRRAGGGAINGRAQERATLTLTGCTVKQVSATQGRQAFDTTAQAIGIFTVNCVIQGGDDACLSYFGGGGTHNNTQFIGGGDSSGNSPAGSVVVKTPKNEFVLFFSFGSGAPCTIRDPVGASTPGLRIIDSTISAIFIGLTIANCQGPCVQLDQGGDYVEDGETLFPGIIDGGGNTGVGFFVAGLGAKLSLQSGGGTNASGALGDVQVGGAAPVSFATLTASPISDLQTFARAQRP